MRTCDLDGCERRYYGKGLCRMHYTRQQRHGDPMATMRPAQALIAPPHRSPEECGRWLGGMGTANGCPHWTARHWAAIEATQRRDPMWQALNPEAVSG